MNVTTQVAPPRVSSTVMTRPPAVSFWSTLCTLPPANVSTSAAGPPVKLMPPGSGSGPFVLSTVRRSLLSAVLLPTISTEWKLRIGAENSCLPPTDNASSAGLAALRSILISGCPAGALRCRTACCASATSAFCSDQAPRPCVATASTSPMTGKRRPGIFAASRW